MRSPDSPVGLDELARELELEEQIEKQRRLRYRLTSFAPNPRQWDFASSGGPATPKAHECLLSGPNQAGGKTYTLQYLITVHSTGLYPPEWEGPRFTKPPPLAVACETAATTRDQIYFGTDGDDACMFGSKGWVPEDCYDPKEDLITLGGNYENMLDYALIDWHDENGVKRGKTTVRFFGYAKGWKKLQGLKLDGIFLNEMPPDDVYDEMRARINKTMGYIWIAACPLEGETETYMQFEKDDTGYLNLLTYTIDDCTHLSQEEYDFIFNRWKNHPQAEARLYGRPCRAAGMIYAYPRREIVEPPFHASPEDPQIIGLDFPHGTGTFAAVKGVLEVERDVLHIVDEFKAANQETSVYVDRVKMMGGERIPIAWPHDGGMGFGQTTSGGTIAEKYRSYGLRMMKSHAFVYDHMNRQSRSIMTAIEMVQDRFSTGRLKINQNCRELMEEIRLYRHDKGKVKQGQNDHLIDALHKLIMMLRYAKSPSDMMPGKSRGFPTKGGFGSARGEYDFFS